MLRILFFPRETFPTFRVDVDVLFGRKLLGRGHAIDFVMQARDETIPVGPRPWNGRTVWVGPTDSGSGMLHRARKQWLGLLHDVRHLRRSSRVHYDAIQIRDKFLIAALAVLVARRRSMKCYLWLSFPVPEFDQWRAKNGLARYPRLTSLRGRLSERLLYWWIIPRADHTFVQSEKMKEMICRKSKVDLARVTPVPMGIDLEDLPTSAVPNKDRLPSETSSASAAERAGNGRFQIAYLGSLGSERHLEILVDMLADLIRRGADASLLMIGDGNDPKERQELEALASKLGVAGRMEITGFLPRSEALMRAREADICVSPIFPTEILNLASPTKLVEYLALGKPVIANHHPEQRLVLRACRAGVCVPWSARHFARAALWLMKRNPAERAAMGAAGREWVARHRTYDRIADELEHQYAGFGGRQPVPRPP